jgi:hypothetical protein
MIVCQFCTTTILKSTRSWDVHHGSWVDLEQSEKQGCVFCKALYQDIVKVPALKNEGRAHDWPQYRWTIRSLCKTRATKETVTVTFRQIIRDQRKEERTGEEKTIVEIPLPSRTFCLFPEADLGVIPTPEALGLSTHPGSSGAQIKSWMQICDRTHEVCLKRRKDIGRNAFVPTRLLDIRGPARDPIKVIETKWDEVDGPYATLSHCWGRIEFVTLTTKTRDRYKTKGVPWEDLPVNFKQAIEVARFLGVKYIWIDSLCIIQGRDGDFKDEAGKMHQVYRNSYCNIAIADSENSVGGLFRPRKPEEVIPVRYEANGKNPMLGAKSWRIVPEDLWDKELLQTILYTRGWVFQERMLAPRILHFAHKQIFWDCPTISASECLPAGLPDPVDSVAGPDRHWRGRLQEPGTLAHGPLAGPNDDSLQQFWKKAVKKYTSCNLTKGRDKTIAMWGIAKLVRDGLQQRYGHGLWEPNLEEQLAWRVAECTEEERPSESKNDDKARNIPSWSWASMDGTIEVQLPADERYYRAKNHYQRPLSFDLKGANPVSSPEAVAKRLPPQPRGWSDGVVELLKHQEERGRGIGRDEHNGQRTRSPDKIKEDEAKPNPDDEPEFNSTAIPIQGHVGHGHLRWSVSKAKWLLDIPGLTGTEIECFPDIKPKKGNDDFETPYFIVLSAYKVAMEDQNIVENEEYVGLQLWGIGILLKRVGDRRFHRTGALGFRNISTDIWKKLQVTYGGEELSHDEYDAEYGLKFWLE